LANSPHEFEEVAFHNAHRLDPRPRRLNAEQARGLAALDAAPELLLGREQLIDKITDIYIMVSA
jgi:hypothetical protein